MIDQNSTFFKMSKEIAVDFLQSTVIVDDFTLPRYPSSEDRTLMLPVSVRRPPLRNEEQMLQTQSPSPQQGVTKTDTEIDQSSNPYFDARAVISAFAKKRIVCSVVNPQETERESLPELIRNLADCADILVIDWSLHNDEGEMAMQILASILHQDATRTTDRLRLLAIYTGSPAIARISSQVRDYLDQQISVRVEEDQDGFALTHGATSVIILAKPEGDKIPADARHRIVAFDALVECLTDEFTQMTAGLVSNVVVNSLAHLRKSTFKMLGRFSGDLDAPYLTHRLLQDNLPEDAEEDLVMLFSREIEAILEETGAGSCAGVEAIKAWLEINDIKGFELGGNKSLTHDQIIELFTKGIAEFKVDGMSKKAKESLHEKATRQLYHSAEDGHLDEKFAHLTVMRSFYENKPPTLTLGTILKAIKRNADDPPEYWVCLLPRCDTVRLDNDQAFPFLPLVINQSRFNVVLHEGDTYTRLFVATKPYDLRVFIFRPEAIRYRKVVAIKESGNYLFKDVCGDRFQWMGELRGDHALRLSHSLAANMSRVGLSESKWLERSAK